jgi:Carbohydrate binding domain (family 11)
MSLAGSILVERSEYPASNADPAACDIHLEVVNRNWTAGRAIAFRAKSAHTLRLSVSFLDRNRVAYTAWTELEADVWQEVRIGFDQIRPNPYFQPPDAKSGAPLDVSEVAGVAFAPQDRTSGHLAVGRFVVVP